MRSSLTLLFSSLARPAARTPVQQQTVNRPLVLAGRTNNAGAEQRRREQSARETAVRARLEAGTSLLRMRNSIKARDIFCALVKELEQQRVTDPLTGDARLLAAAYAGRARAFAPATPAGPTFTQVLGDFDRAMRLDPAWTSVLQRERRAFEVKHQHGQHLGPLHNPSHFLPF
eukprot:m.31912 g.31912  ORF g.31912 m.31912 type:complete len:173 (+) comp9351_c2_seq1:2052-2570(+)